MVIREPSRLTRRGKQGAQERTFEYALKDVNWDDLVERAAPFQLSCTLEPGTPAEMPDFGIHSADGE